MTNTCPTPGGTYPPVSLSWQLSGRVWDHFSDRAKRGCALKNAVGNRPVNLSYGSHQANQKSEYAARNRHASMFGFTMQCKGPNEPLQTTRHNILCARSSFDERFSSTSVTGAHYFYPPGCGVLDDRLPIAQTALFFDTCKRVVRKWSNELALPTAPVRSV